MGDKTLPCPYCGHMDTQMRPCGDDEGWRVVCNVCCASGPRGVTTVDAGARWSDGAQQRLDIKRPKIDLAAAKHLNHEAITGAVKVNRELKEQREAIARLKEDLLEEKRARSAQSMQVIERDSLLETKRKIRRKDIETIQAARARIALLEKTLRFIDRVDKTPNYTGRGTQADKDRHGQLPKESGQRWKTPRELVKDLKLPEVTDGGKS